MNILVINCGSSSIKYQLIDLDAEQALMAGGVESIGKPHSKLSHKQIQTDGSMKTDEYSRATSNHRDAFALIQELFNKSVENNYTIDGIGHRVVHGGERFKEPILIDDEVLEVIGELSQLAPLHNPANLTGIEVCLQLYPKLPQVAVFDTAFHQTMPPHAYRYALPEAWYSQYQVRRYGFHGTSHAYVTKQAAKFLNIHSREISLISLHLGNGASVAAIKNGVSVDTSMGLTPLEGLVMGSRSGDIDPAIPFYIQAVSGDSNDNIVTQLNKHSGIKGICGHNDMREVQQLASAGDPQAQLALNMYCYRARKYIGSYYAVLDHIHALVFTAGIGENSATVRWHICEGLAGLGVEIDTIKNQSITDEISAIHTNNSKCQILVIRTNEELEIAVETRACMAS